MVRLHCGADWLEIFPVLCCQLSTPSENDSAAGFRQAGPAVSIGEY
jgi:hypothetical protein